jgi:hypothetical protein
LCWSVGEHRSCLIDAKYYDIDTLKNSSWQERTEVLTKGGYTHYCEKTATMLGELADLVLDKYVSGPSPVWDHMSSNLTPLTSCLQMATSSNLLKHAESSPPKIRATVKAIEGIGQVGLDIFCDTAQGVWPCLSPFIDPRSLKTAEELGLGGVEELWQQVGEDPLLMCKLATALTTVRLDKKIDYFQS